MPVTDAFRAYVEEQLGRVEPVTTRKMFGGLGIYAEGLFFALAADNVIYFKVGEENLADFEAHAEKLGVSANVHFHGWVESKEEMDGFFAGAHALVMPTSTHPEGVPRSIDEALVRKIPVVATRIAGVPDEFANGEALLVDPSAPDQIADGIETLLYDRAERARYIEGADRRRRQWTAFASAAEQHAKYLRDGTLDR